MKTKHTPDSFKLTPWRVDFDSDMNLGVFTRRDDSPGSLNNFAVACGIQDEEEARLIASAPELLEALQRAVEQFDYTVKSMTLGHAVSISSLQNCSAMARQAIAKATGGQC